ncbi:hypothetical protein Peur_061622 [Populus x canadensis]|jgi:hypothetical protein
MGIGNCRIVAALILIPSCFCSGYDAATDTITSSQPIKDPETVSAGNIFEMGFFSPVNLTNRYVGIWYNNVSATKPEWVPNRNNPIADSSGAVTISEDGNLAVLKGHKEILWSSNVSNRVRNSIAQVLDDGNLVLQGSSKGIILWRSFPDDETARSFDLSSAVPHLCGRNSLFPIKFIA